MPWLRDPELFDRNGPDLFDQADPQTLRAALAGFLAPPPADEPEPASPENLLDLLGKYQAFHDENRRPFLRLLLDPSPSPPEAAPPAGAVSPASASPGAPASPAAASPLPALSAADREQTAVFHALPLAEAAPLLSRLHYLSAGALPPQPLLRRSLALLRLEALQPSAERPVFNRFAIVNGVGWLDLCDRRGRAVELAPGRWSVYQNPAPLFLRSRHQLPLPFPQCFLPDPAQNARQIDRLRPFLPALSAPDWLLLLAWLAACCLPSFPRPLLCLLGPSGSGKSTLALLLRRLLDPSRRESLPLASPAALSQSLHDYALPIFDHLSPLAPAQLDRLCRAVSGDSLAVPQPDGDFQLFPFRRPIVLAARELPSHAPEFLDRALILPLPPPGPDRLFIEDAYWTNFYFLRPRLLGALLDLVCQALPHYQARAQKNSEALAHAQTVPSLPPALARWPAFAAWGAAVAAVLELPPDAFPSAFAAQAARVRDSLLEVEPLVDSLLALLARQPRWQGAAEDLLAALDAPASRSAVIALGIQLRRLQPIFAACGVRLGFSRNNGKRLISLEMQ